MEATVSNDPPVEETTADMLVYGEHVAHSAQEAIARCPFLSKMPVEQAEVLLQLLPEQPQAELDKNTVPETKIVEPDAVKKDRPQLAESEDLTRNTAVAESQTEQIEAVAVQPQLVHETEIAQPVLQPRLESAEPNSPGDVPQQILAEQVEAGRPAEEPPQHKPNLEQEMIKLAEPIVPPAIGADLRPSTPVMIEAHPEQDYLAASTASTVEDLQTQDYAPAPSAASVPEPKRVAESSIASTDVDVYGSTPAIETIESGADTEPIEPSWASEPAAVFTAGNFAPAPDSLSEYATVGLEEISPVEDGLLPVETLGAGQDPLVIAPKELLPEEFLGTAPVLNEAAPDLPIEEAREAVAEVLDLLAQKADIQQEAEEPLTSNEVEALVYLLQSLNVQEPVRVIAHLNEKYKASEVRDIIQRDLRELIRQIDTQFYLMNLLANSANPTVTNNSRLRRIGGFLYQFTHRHSHAFTFGV